MILHCTILFPLITWACIFFLFSNALGMLLPLWDSNEYIPISKRHWMQWRLQWFFFFFFFKLSASIFPCPISSSVKAPEERRQAKTRTWMEQTEPYCTRWKYLGWYFLGCKCSEAGTVSLPVCTVPYNAADLKAGIAIQNLLNLVLFLLAV